MQYGPTGRSLGSATVIFHKADDAAKAVKALDNIRIDNRLIKVEVLLSANEAPLPASKASLSERVTYGPPFLIEEDIES
jgi:THO complex subunit 4